MLQVFAAPGASLAEMTRLGKRISQELLDHKSVATVEQQIGRAELGEDPWGPHRCEFHVELKNLSGRDQAGIGDELRGIGQISGD